MSREKILQAEIVLKDEQLADLTKDVERLRRQAEELEKRVQTTDASESKIAELKQTINKIAPAAKQTVQYAAELNEARRRLAVVEKERSELSKNYAATQAQTAALESALDKRQKDLRALNSERKETAARAKTAEAMIKATARKNLTIIFIAAIFFAGTICGSYAYVKTALAPPAELSDEAAAAFKQHAAEYRLVIETAVRGEREQLKAERDKIQEFNDETIWDKIAFYAWLALLFSSGFVVGAITIIAAFIFRIR